MNAPIHGMYPMLEVADVGRAAKWYCRCLGFEEVFVMDDPGLPGYGVVEREGMELHLFGNEDRDPQEVRPGVYGNVPDVDGLYAQLQAADAFHPLFPRELDAIREHPPEDKDYGMRDLIFVDPDGHILCFGQPLDE